jgi:ribosomal protein L11 methyltransferase
VPYRIDLADPPADALDRLVALGALDVEQTSSGLAALIPDGVPADSLAVSLGVRTVPVSPAVARDDGSVWILSPRPVRAGTLLLVPVDDRPVPPDALRLHDSGAFGTGLHPTTALCLEALEESIGAAPPARVLDVGTGSGVLALAALLWGVPHAVGLDIDADALRVAAENARVNGRVRQLHLVLGGPDAVRGGWPLVVANILPAPLIEMAPALVRGLGHGGRLVLSGIPESVASEVEQAYRRLGLRTVRSESRAGWSVLVLAASW